MIDYDTENNREKTTTNDEEQTTMTYHDIAASVKAIVIKNLSVDEDKVLEDARFIEDLGADSLDTVELVMAFEEEFGIEISDDKTEEIRTVKDAIIFIANEKRAKQDADSGA